MAETGCLSNVNVNNIEVLGSTNIVEGNLLSRQNVIVVTDDRTLLAS